MDDLWVVLPHIGAGGAQKVGLLAAEHFAAQGFKVRVLSLRHGHPIKHAIPDGVELLDLGPDVEVGGNRSLIEWGCRFTTAQLIKLCRFLTLAGLQLTWRWCEHKVQPDADAWVTRLLAWCMEGLGGLRYRRLRALLQQQRPKRVLALLTKTNILCSAAVWDLPIHLVVSERNDPRLQSIDRLWSRLRCVYYRRADVVTANTEGVLEALQAMGPWQRLALLPNPLPTALTLQDSHEPPVDREAEVLAVARLVPQKGLDVLIRAFASLPESVRDGWSLTLVGDGPELATLQALASDAGLRDLVHFEGFRSDPLVFMRRASIFALPSRFEGMPNALLEAMAAGLPSVVTDASPGPLEMVCNGHQGLVVPTDDVSAFAAALQKLMLDGDLRNRCGVAARTTLRALDWDVVESHWRSVLALPA